MDMPRMDMPSHNTSDFFKHGSIFDRARDFPVRSFPNSAFFNKTSPAREASPARQVPVFTDASSTVPPPQQPHPASQQQQSQPRGSSQPRQTPSPPTAAQQQQQYQQEQAQRYQQYQQEQQAAKQQQAAAHDQPDAQSKPMPPPPPSANDPISKIQKIQRDVLQIFDQVEKFQGNNEGKKDKTYIYLDEMLTQNLLKLDSIDAEDQPQIKSARREAIKSINHCIAVLEAKAEAAGSAANNASESTNSSSGEQQQQVPNGTTDRTGSGASLSHSSSNSSSQQQQQQQPE